MTNRHSKRRRQRQLSRSHQPLIADNERLRSIETAARRFVGEANSHPRYITVRTWATAEADPYLNLKSALTGTR